MYEWKNEKIASDPKKMIDASSLDFQSFVHLTALDIDRGNFYLKTTNKPNLTHKKIQKDGWVDFVITASTANGYEHEFWFSDKTQTFRRATIQVGTTKTAGGVFKLDTKTEVHKI